ncbi:mechanosensitive ion channel family protein, partial [Phormidesmis sp. 146-33]
EDSQRLALRFSTFSRVVKSLSAIVLLSIGVLTALSIAGIEVMPLLAGAGIIGLGISLASQNLIKDVINGFLILMEDQYAVGDVIQVGKASGLVESMNLRITQLRNAEGRLITIPNSAITIVENLSKDWSRVDLAIVISYSTNLDNAIAAIEKVGQDMSRDPAWKTQILEPPEVLGADDLDSTGVTLRVWIKTQPLQQWKVGREYRRRLKFALDEEGIEIGVPQQAFSVKGSLDEKAFEGNSNKPSSHR